MRKSTRSINERTVVEESESNIEDEDEELSEDDFQFGIWLRHRRIDGALNRVPNNFYAVWHMFSANVV
ncbi:hypothetical protein OSTOST_01828, partial [Ostertagia ostertagi]